MKIGVSLPVRELGGDLAAGKAFAQAAKRLGFSHLRAPDMVLRPGGGWKPCLGGGRRGAQFPA